MTATSAVRAVHDDPARPAGFRGPGHVHKVIARRRLTDLLDREGPRPLTVIHAPAGYGKTTVAVQWLQMLHARGATVAWMGLHRDDDTPHWFLSHLLGTVRGVLPDPASVDDLLGLIEQNAEDTRTYTVSALLEILGAHPGPFVLALDDWHLVESPEVHRTLMQLLDLAPPNLVVLLTSRRRPRLPLSRLRVGARLTEIDADALRFDLVETREFLVELNGLCLGGDDVARLSEGTDGWVAALQLASLSLRDTDDPETLIRGFSGRHHSVGEYLAENVLDALPADLLDLLLATSVCDRLCGGLAGALAGRPDGGAALAELESRDLFLRALDPEREWFRYHHLFAEYLRRRLERDHPGRAAELHRRASAWFAGHDLVTEAVVHALAGGDVTGATDLVERHAMPLVEHSRMVSLLGLVRRLPPTAADGRPRLLMAVAWANCLLQRSDAAQATLDVLRAALPADDAHDELHSEADVVQACIDVYADRTDRAELLVRRSLDRSLVYRPWVVAVAANIQSFCDLHAGRFERARERQRWARRVHDRAGGPFAGVYGRCFAGIAALSTLDVDGAERQLRDAVALAREMAGRRSHAAQLAGALLGELCHLRGEREEAERLLTESAELGAESGVVDFMVASYALLARIRAAAGAGEESAELLAEGARVADRLGLPRLRAAVGAERIDQLIARNRIRQARRAAQELPTGADLDGGIAVRVDSVRVAALAAVLAAEGETDRATALLEELAAEARRRGRVREETELTVRLAGVLESAARRIAAERILAPALERAVTAGAPQLVLDGGREVRAVVARLRARVATDGAGDPAPDRLASLLDDGAAAAGSAEEAGLTAREREILVMLDLGRDNRGIADGLGVTVNTVKWYLKHIYGALGVRNRTEAVSVARRRGLLG
ncbi:LuxR C-terminal-related transcriptional regulator [Pseudonocardia alni]|uniref:LuxR C-terminal-related transcriptional regulator n=1 Tax=Pseudonocardia alni TaxID=33907 RepID=UPI0036B8FAC0